MFERLNTTDLARGMILTVLEFVKDGVASLAAEDHIWDFLVTPRSYYVICSVFPNRSSEAILLSSSNKFAVERVYFRHRKIWCLS